MIEKSDGADTRETERIHFQWILVCLAVALATSASPAAEDWNGRIGGAYVWLDASGNEDSFLSQYNLRPGFVLEDLQLHHQGAGSLEEFTVDARGFGSAFPTQTARVGLRFRGGVGLHLDYDRRQSFFNLAGSDFALRSDDWDITRWKGAVVVDTWKPLRAEVIVRRYEIDGTVNRPLYGLNELYPIAVALDDSMTEGTIRLATRTLPVQIDFEQSLARYERKHRRSSAGEEALTGPDPDLLADASTGFDDTQDVPTTRLTVSYADSWFQALGTVLWSDTELDASGTGQTTYAVGGGAIGTISFVDEVMGSAQNENLVGALNLGFSLPRNWVVRVAAETRDVTTDAALLGRRLVRADGPLGSPVEFGTAVDDSGGKYDSKDTSARLRVEYRRPAWSVWGGLFAASRDVAWRQTVDDDLFEVERTNESYLLGAAVTPGRYLDLTLEYTQGDFTRFVFRTDPGPVDRAVFKLRSKIGRGWQLGAHGRYVKASNPAEVAGVAYRSLPYGLTASWNASDGASSATIDVERMTIESETGLVLPTGEPGTSLYDLDVTSATAHGHIHAGIVKFRGSGTYLMDDGETWPLQSWNVIARFTLEGPAGLEYGVFAERWSYDEDRTDFDDYDVTRAGVILAWSFR